MPNFERTSPTGEASSPDATSNENRGRSQAISGDRAANPPADESAARPVSPPSPDDNPYPILQATADGTLVYANAASQFLRDYWQCQIGDRLSQRWQRQIQRAIAHNCTQNLQAPVGERWYDFQIVPAGDRANLYGSDITDRYRAEQALHSANAQLTHLVRQRTARLKQSDRQLQLQLWERLSTQQNLRERERQLDAIVREAGVGIALLDSDGRIVRSNPALQTMLGASDLQLQHARFLDTLADPARQDSRHPDPYRDIEQAIASGRSLPTKLELRYRHRNGSSFWGTLALSAISVPERFAIERDDQQPPFFVAIVEDITDSKLARDALQLTQFAIDTAADAALWMMPSGQFAYANDAACAVLGYPAPDLLQRRFDEIAPDFQANDWAGLWESLASTRSVTFETRMQRQDGDIFPVDLTLNYIEFNDRQYICAFARDISERKQAEEALRTAQERSERLLLNIFPAAIAKQLKQRTREYRQVGAAIAQRFEDVTVLFADIVGFTRLCAQSSPSQLVRTLNEIFSGFDRLTQARGLEKIKTIGDAYMAVGGLPEPRDDSAEAVAELALDMMREVARFSAHSGEPIVLRVGIATGPVVAGVIGLNKFSYDLWGDTVNLASRMESLGVPACIQVTQTTYERLRHRYIFEKRGKLQVKGKGETIAYLLLDRQDRQDRKDYPDRPPS